MTAALAAAEGCHFDNDARLFRGHPRPPGGSSWSRFGPATESAPPLSIRRPGSSGTGVGESSLPHSGPSPSSVAAGHERQATLHERLATLPSHYREVITLYRLEELPLEEVRAHGQDQARPVGSWPATRSQPELGRMSSSWSSTGIVPWTISLRSFSRVSNGASRRTPMSSPDGIPIWPRN